MLITKKFVFTAFVFIYSSYSPKYIDTKREKNEVPCMKEKQQAVKCILKMITQSCSRELFPAFNI